MPNHLRNAYSTAVLFAKGPNINPNFMQARSYISQPIVLSRYKPSSRVILQQHEAIFQADMIKTYGNDSYAARPFCKPNGYEEPWLLLKSLSFYLNLLEDLPQVEVLYNDTMKRHFIEMGYGCSGDKSKVPICNFLDSHEIQYVANPKHSNLTCHAAHWFYEPVDTEKIVEIKHRKQLAFGVARAFDITIPGMNIPELSAKNRSPRPS